jgi:dTDP-4-dehydrorhamnose 3,5-epimerase
MIFHATPLPGVWTLEPQRHADDRGHFARTWCRDECAAHGLNPALAQCSSSFNRRRGTLRGMHFQRPPHAEDKLVRCTRGAVFDVALDLRPDSPTFKRWHGVELSADNGAALYVPAGCAHGFQTLADDSEVLYLISTPYAPDHAAGVRFDDPAFGIAWPDAARAIVHARDRAYPDFPA